MGNCEYIFTKDNSKVESASLGKIFEECCPIYMGYGMSYDEFWYDDPFKAKFQRKAHEIQIRKKDEEFWMQGMYIYEALCDVSPILHAFSKSGTKPLPYSDKPFLAKREDNLTKEEKEQKIKNDRMIARLHFEQWARATADHFNKNK